MPDLFISHATKDDAHADALAAALADHDLTCWIDHRGGLEPGDTNWDRGIRNAIKECGAGLLLMSPHSLGSDICAAECLMMRGLGKPLYVAYLDTSPPEDIWLYIKMIQYADLRDDFVGGVTRIAHALKGKTTHDSPTPVKARITGFDTLMEHLPYLNAVPFVGREHDVRKLRDKLGSHVIQIIGVGGLGKSRLAAEIALSASNGVIWHRCSEASLSFQVIDLLRQHFDLDDKIEEDVVLKALDRNPPLVVIDNAQDVRVKTELKSYISILNRITSHGAQVILTSRATWSEFKPRIQYALNPLSLNQALDVAMGFAKAEDIDLSEANARTLAELSRMHPSLIEFSVRLLHELDCDAVQRQLRELRHNAVHEVLDEMVTKTVRQMHDDADGGVYAEALLRRLTVMRGTFDRDGVLALKPPDMSNDSIDNALVLLVRWGFLRFIDSRYRVEEIVTRAISSDTQTQEAHFRYYVNCHSDYNANNDEVRHTIIKLDWENISAALAWGLAAHQIEAVNWVWSLRYYMSLQVSRAEWRHFTEIALDSAQQNNDVLGQANMLKALGDIEYIADEYLSAQSYYQRALLLYERLSNHLGSANTLTAMGEISHITQDFLHARACFSKALRLYDLLKHDIGMATVLLILGEMSLRAKEYGLAYSYYTRALSSFTKSDDRLGQAHAEKGLAEVGLQQNDFPFALEHLNHSLSIYIETGDSLGRSQSLRLLGDTARQMKSYDEAQHYYKQALKLGEEMDDMNARLSSMQGLAEVKRDLGRNSEAIEDYKSMVRLASSHSFFRSHPIIQDWQQVVYELQHSIPSTGLDETP